VSKLNSSMASWAPGVPEHRCLTLDLLSHAGQQEIFACSRLPLKTAAAIKIGIVAGESLADLSNCSGRKRVN